MNVPTKYQIGDTVYTMCVKADDPKECPTCHQAVYDDSSRRVSVNADRIVGVIARIGCTEDNGVEYQLERARWTLREHSIYPTQQTSREG